ncbi:MAG: DNA repair protein RecO C-terminal domain-containing protein, partial [Xanthobacteraceae bacterium]
QRGEHGPPRPLATHTICKHLQNVRALLRGAATGANDNLAFVSPKTGRAISRSAGEAWRDKLLPLPAFLMDPPSSTAPPAADLVEAFRLTGYFLSRHVFEPRGLRPPEARARFIALIGRQKVTAE